MNRKSETIQKTNISTRKNEDGELNEAPNKLINLRIKLLSPLLIDINGQPSNTCASIVQIVSRSIRTYQVIY